MRGNSGLEVRSAQSVNGAETAGVGAAGAVGPREQMPPGQGAGGGGVGIESAIVRASAPVVRSFSK